MIEALPDFPSGTVGFRLADHITRADYEAVLIPTLNAAFKQHKTLRVYCEIVSFSGTSPGAMWDHLEVGWGHLGHWERGAIVTDIDWISNTTQLFAFLFPYVRVFSLFDAAKARAWIVGADASTS
jgi:hypothetical protein